MAEHGTPSYATATGNDYDEHRRTYASVMKLAKVGTAMAIAGLIALAAFGVGGAGWIMTVGLLLTLVAGTIGLASPNGTLKPLAGTIVIILLLWAVAG